MLRPTMSFHPVSPLFACHYGASESRAAAADGAIHLHLQLPHLAGAASESLNVPGAAIRHEHGFMLIESGHFMLGFSMIDAAEAIDRAAKELYAGLLQISRGRHLYRVWNYVPQINSTVNGLERYRQFNIGRWQAFESAFGNHLRSHLPAASAVGINGDKLVLVFAAGHLPARHLENPEQVPAYHYPHSYGPRSPGFARASLLHSDHLEVSFISGTASIRGHASMHTNNLAGQLEVTLDNLEIMGRQMEIDLFDASTINDHWRFKCYLRHPQHLALVQELLSQRLGPVAENCIYLQADICRSELDIEMEASRIAMV